MSQETEKLFIELNKKINAAGDSLKKEEIELMFKELIEQYNENGEAVSSAENESADLLEQAYSANSTAEAKKFAKKALEINENNFDAKIFLAGMEDTPIKALNKMNKLISVEEARLREEGFFEDVGIFWGLIETRPFMRALHSKLFCLIDLSRFTEALELAEYMLTLCEGDNLGIRYMLMGLYAALERFEDGEKLYTKFGEKTLFFLFPYMILKFRKGDYTKCKKILKDINNCNNYILDILLDKEPLQEDVPSMYALNSREEANLVLSENSFLLMATPSVLEFIKIFNDKT